MIFVAPVWVAALTSKEFRVIVIPGVTRIDILVQASGLIYVKKTGKVDINSQMVDPTE